MLCYAARKGSLRPHNCALIGLCLLTLLHGLPVKIAQAQFDFEKAPINYQTAAPTDRVMQLSKRVADGTTELTWDAQHGWLPAVMKALDVQSETQTLVFSKTSQQFRQINPSRPRALYFADDVYVGWVQHGDFLELAAVDPTQGATFYKIEQSKSKRPVIRRDTGQCLSCHASSKTKNVPGFLVRSLYPQADGLPEFRFGSLTTDHSTPFAKRFGGWYVTGAHGKMRHRGNVTITGDEDHPIDAELGANKKKLPSNVKAEAYLEPTSDVAALMVLEHQTQMHNRVTRASYTARQAMHYQAEMNRVLDRADDFVSDSVKRRIRSASEDLVRYLFFCDEYVLTSPVRGNSQFAANFAQQGPRDSKGRSLRELDLQRRLLKYPCSYLVYTVSFVSLPSEVRTIVQRRMREVLTEKDESNEFSHLSKHDRIAIWEILVETHPWFRKSEN